MLFKSMDIIIYNVLKIKVRLTGLVLSYHFFIFLNSNWVVAILITSASGSADESLFIISLFDIVYRPA